MRVLINPQSYDIVFSVASLVLIVVTFFIHMSEDNYYNKQRYIFGGVILVGFMINLMALIHNFYLESDSFKRFLGYEGNTYVVILERAFIYVMPYVSTKYVMSIFQIEPDNVVRKLALVLPMIYAIFFFASVLFTDFFFSFTEEGKIKYHYPQGATVNFSVILYFIFALYLLIKYTRTLSSEKATAIWIYYFLMLSGIPIRIITKSSAIFEFSVSIALLLCVYTFQNPSEFMDRMSGAGTRNALNFAISTNLIQKREFTLLGIHIDRFSTLIGSESIETASDLLVQISQYLHQMCQPGNLFFLDTGDFILLFPGTAPDEDIVEKTEGQIRKRFKDNWNIRGEEIKLFESPFVMGFPDEVDSLERFGEVKGVLDKALLKQSRDIIRISDLNMKIVEHDKKIDGIVKRALEDNLLEVYYQPIYAPESGKFTSCEALLRLKDPQLGFISPAIFMPIAERNGSILAIDKYVLSSVCDMIANSGVRECGLEYVEVNLSVVDCIQTNLTDNVMTTLNKYQVKPSEINFEITETYEQGITSVMNENIRKLNDIGITFSMDDFGTGYSNLARIATMPCKLFKLDKSIIQAAFDSEVSYMVMLNLIKIIKSLKKEIVAEGVETGEQARQIIKLGCDHIQGFFYARPLPKDKFIEFIKDHNG
ncbi:MAG: EAL domain-containing protein [Butyrivibrio sp.]|nr:EAL domain-containing protein [Butyrivibrio sp.]